MLALVLILAPYAVGLPLLCLVSWRYIRVRRELDEARAECEGLAALSAEVHADNYRLACELYGQPAVDRAIRQADRSGNN